MIWKQCRVAVITTVILVFGGYGKSIAQTALPRIESLHPSGGQRGKSVDITIEGINIGFGTRLVIDCEGVKTDATPLKPPPAKNASSKLIVHFTISPDAIPGLRKLRVITPMGASDIAMFDVGQWAEIEEKEPNNNRSEAQQVRLPTTVVGKIDPAEDVDWFKFHAEKGHQIICDVMAARQGSALDSVLSVQDKDGRELAFSDDFNGSDSLIAFTPQKSDDYYLSLRDLRYQGSAAHSYRLTMGEIPYVTSSLPAGGPAGAVVDLYLNGFNLAGVTTGKVKLPMGEFDNPVLMPITLPNGFSNSVLLAVEDIPSLKQNDSNDTLKTAQQIPVPATVYGRIIAKAGVTAPNMSYYRFKADKNQKFILEVLAQRLGSHLDSNLTVTDLTGKELASNDDAIGKDSRLEFIAPQSADYIAQIRDMTQKQGPDYIYEFTIHPAKPDFRLSFAPDHPSLGQGGAIPLKVNVSRMNGYDGDIAVELKTLPKGVSLLGPSMIPKGSSELNIILTAAKDAPMLTADLNISGVALIDSKMVQHKAQSQSEQFTKDGDKLNRSTSPTILPVISLTAAPEFSIVPPVDSIKLMPGKSIDIVVKVVRKEGFTAKIPISVLGLPAGVSAAGVDIPEKLSEVKLILKADDKQVAGKSSILIVGQLGVDELHPTPQCSAPIQLEVSKPAKK